MVRKTLDEKLAEIHADPSGSKAFIIADAKDADMAFGIGAPGVSPERHDGEVRFKTLAEYRQQIREIVAQGVVDIMLMSAHTNEILNIQERIFDKSHITPAGRANDTTDIHVVRGSRIFQSPALPFRSASLDHLQCGHLDCKPEERHLGANLGLYSVTFSNNTELDRSTLEQFKLFREEAERKNFRYFLEVFDPNIANAIEPELLGHFINDLVARTLAGVATAGRPAFLKIVYHGPKAIEDLVRYDPHLIVGILGGGAGTTLDAFQLIHQAQKYGARVALFGRKINQAENQLAFIEFLRLIVDGVIEPEEAVRAYHAVLEKLGTAPRLSLEEDLQLRTNVMSYSGSGTTISVPPVSKPETIQPSPSERLASSVATSDNSSSSRSESTSPPTETATSSGADGSSSAMAPNQSSSIGPAVSSHIPAGSAVAKPVSMASSPPTAASKSSNSQPQNSGPAGPNFAKMTSAERLAYHRERLKRMFGG